MVIGVIKMTRGQKSRCVEGSKKSLKAAEEQRDIKASNDADDYATRMERAAECAWDSEIEW